MKQHYPFNTAKLVLMLMCFGSAALGQGAPPPGYFRFVNAAGLTGKISLTIDAMKLKPEGFAAGDTTGLLGMASGPRKITVSSSEAGTAVATVTVQPNTSTTIIASCKVVVDQRTHTAKKELQISERVNPPLDNGRHFQILYVSSQAAVDVAINGTPRRINAMRELDERELPGAKIKIEQAGKTVVAFDAPQAGNFLMLLYDDSAGKLAGVAVPDYK